MNATTRRTVLRAASALVAVPLLARAQQPAKIFRIGFLTNGTVVSTQVQLDTFRAGLGEHGWGEGRQYVIEPRYADGKLERLAGLADELLARKVDLIYAPSGIAAQAMKNLGTKVPVIFAFAPDPVGQGFGATLSRPGGNMTGLTSTHTELSAKRVEILREAFPSIRRIAVLYFRAGPAAGVSEQLAETERAAKVLGLSVVTEESPRLEDFDRAFASIRRERPDALIVIENPLFFTNRARLTELAAALRIPAIYNSVEYVNAGGLMCYGANYADLSRRAGTYAFKILTGTPPGELPIERPTKLELVINMKTAKAFGLTVPQAVLLRADKIIE